MTILGMSYQSTLPDKNALQTHDTLQETKVWHTLDERGSGYL